jgi:hypothetical protein
LKLRAAAETSAVRESGIREVIRWRA